LSLTSSDTENEEPNHKRAKQNLISKAAKKLEAQIEKSLIGSKQTDCDSDSSFMSDGRANEIEKFVKFFNKRKPKDKVKHDKGDLKQRLQ